MTATARIYDLHAERTKREQSNDDAVEYAIACLRWWMIGSAVVMYPWRMFDPGDVHGDQ